MWAGVRSDQNRQDSVRQAATPGKTSKVFAGYDMCNGSSSLPSAGFSWDSDHAQESSTKWPEPDDMVFLGDVPPNCLNSEKFSPTPFIFIISICLTGAKGLFFLKVQSVISMPPVASGIPFCSGESALFKLSVGER